MKPDIATSMTNGERGTPVAWALPASSWRWRLAAVMVLLALAVAALRATRSPVLAAARRAAAEWHVPPSLLLAMAFTESRLSLSSGDAAQSGLIRLMSWRRSRSMARAAELLHTSPDRLQGDMQRSFEGAAALLADAAAQTGVAATAPLADWGPALRAFNGAGDPLADALYAEDVLAQVSAGFRGVDDSGRRIELGAQSTWPRMAAVLPTRNAPPEVVGADFAAWLPASPAAQRPPHAAGPRPVRFIVIHTTELPFSSSVAYFRRPTTAVAAHYLVRASDGAVVQLVDEGMVAFHDACFNDESIGVEHEGFVAAGRRWYSDELYRASARLVREIARRHGIPLDRAHVLGHGETPDCSEHVDPGPDWDWDRYMRYLQGPA